MATYRSIAEAIKQEVEPLLENMHFTGTYPHYRRETGKFAELLSFQTNKYGGSILVEIAHSPSLGVCDESTGEIIPFHALTVWSVDPEQRMRIPSRCAGRYEWFHYNRLWQKLFYDEERRVKMTANRIAKKLTKLEHNFRRLSKKCNP